MDHNRPMMKTKEQEQMHLALHVPVHIQYFLYHLNGLPEEYLEADSTRMTLLYFIIVGLDLLNGLHVADTSRCIDFIYKLQLHPQSDEDISCGYFGFTGGTQLFFADRDHNMPMTYQQGHLAATYTALISLLTLEDKLSQVNKTAIAKGIFTFSFLLGVFSA